MRFTYSQMLDLIATSKVPAGRYDEIFNLYRAMPNYRHLHYHNVEHVEAVLTLFRTLVAMTLLTPASFPAEQLEAAELAVAFHDISHSGRPDSARDAGGWNNVMRALVELSRWNTVHGKKVPIIRACDYIEITEFPHQPFDELLLDGGMNVELACMIRDADILWGMLPGCAEQSMIGLWKERKAVGLEEGELDAVQLLSRQLSFINNYAPQSAAGQIFKDLMLVPATLAWVDFSVPRTKST